MAEHRELQPAQQADHGASAQPGSLRLRGFLSRHMFFLTRDLITWCQENEKYPIPESCSDQVTGFLAVSM